MEKVAPINLRSVREEDVPFIFSSWLRSYHQTRNAKTIDNRSYYAGQHRIIEAILDRPGTEIMVATDKEDETQILGYVVFEHRLEFVMIHWLYVKLPFRNFGIGKQLLAQVPRLKGRKTVVTHLPKLEKKVHMDSSLEYNPYLAWLP